MLLIMAEKTVKSYCCTEHHGIRIYKQIVFTMKQFNEI